VAPTIVGDFVLDGARDQLLVFAPEAPTVPALALPVGPGASALAVDATSAGVTVAVANAGSGDVSVFAVTRGPSIGPERRVGVGARPAALAFADLTRDGIRDLAVADAGSGTISVLAGDGESNFVLRSSVPVGGAPGALVVRQYGRDAVTDVFAADAAAPRLVEVRGTHDGPVLAPSIPLPDAASRAAALAIGAFDRDYFPDLAVADRGSAAVLILHGAADGGLGPPTVAQTDVDPVGLSAGPFGGDFQGDLAVADARTQTVRLLLTPGDRLLSAGAHATHLSAGFGDVAWSRPRGRHDHRLELFTGAAVQELPVAASTRALTPHIGRASPQHPVVSYARCRGHACRPFAWDIATRAERAVRVRVPPGCRVEDVAVWDARIAYVLHAVDRRCPVGDRGLWLRGPDRRARRLAAHGIIGALRSGRVAWEDFSKGDDRWRVRMLSSDGRAQTLDQGSLDGNAESPPTFDGAYAYWTDALSELEAGPTLMRQAIVANGCRQGWPSLSDSSLVGLPGSQDQDYIADFAVDGGRLFYADAVGVFEVDASRVQWHSAWPCA
jgi:hypothetical protein